MNSSAEVKEKSIIVTDQMLAYSYQFRRTVPINLDTASMKPLTFCCHNSIVCFVDEHENYYVIPDMGVQKILEQEGYKKAHFFVPFTNEDYPGAYKNEWKNLKAQYRIYLQTVKHC